MDNRDYAGIEISAEELLVSLHRDQQTLPTKTFPNTPTGHRGVAQYLRRKNVVVRVVMESTGVYGLDLALLLHQQDGIEIMVANPRAARHFAQALMQRSKNDPIDALTLREFALRMPFQPWRPPSSAAMQLCALARRLAAITEICTAEKNRLHAATVASALPSAVRQDLRRSIAFQERALARLTRLSQKVIAADSVLQKRFELLDSIPGVGATSAVALLAELSMLSDLNVRQWVAMAGIDPREYSSGTSVHKKPRISKAGNVHLRRALFMPALVAARFDPHLRDFYQRLLAKGKAKLQAIVAVMRKLLHAIFGMFHHQTTYDGSKLFPIPAPTLEVR